ncbi:MAG: hypothetical protein AB7U82_33625 [Blastocatellales bacterium]
MGDVYKLKHTHGSFTDFETGLVINREDEVEVNEPIGAATQTAIANGRLVLVRTPKKKAAVKEEGNGDGKKAEGKKGEETK